MSQQWLRKASLILVAGEKALDLSNMHFRFSVTQQDKEHPNSANIRVYNLSDDTSQQVVREFSEVVLQAGYEGSMGVIFKGTVRQYVRGKENATDSYLDLLAADGDLGYNFGVVNTTLERGATPAQVTGEIVKAMPGLQIGYTPNGSLGGTLPRGKVLYGMAAALMRQHTASQGQTWSIDNGRVNVIPLQGYLPDEAVVLSSATGLVGFPEQTQEGITCRCLLNPRIKTGARIQIDQRTINQTIQQNPSMPIPYNQRTGFQRLATVTADGFYRVFVAEHEGDTRGQAWHTKIIALSIDSSAQQVKAKE